MDLKDLGGRLADGVWQIFCLGEKHVSSLVGGYLDPCGQRKPIKTGSLDPPLHQKAGEITTVGYTSPTSIVCVFSFWFETTGASPTILTIPTTGQDMTIMVTQGLILPNDGSYVLITESY